MGSKLLGTPRPITLDMWICLQQLQEPNGKPLKAVTAANN